MRRRRVSPPPVRGVDSDEEAAAAELLEVKVEPETWVEQLQDEDEDEAPDYQRGMLQPGEGHGKLMMVLPPNMARSMGIAPPPQGAATRRPSVGDRSTVGDTAADRGAGGGASDTDSDTIMIDPDQFLEMELASGKPEAAVDEDLTSLSWLHDKDVLKGIQLRPAAIAASPPLQPKPEPEEESPTSDYLEEAAEGARSADESPPGPAKSAERFNARRHPDHQAYAYDPKIHVHFKPPFSFSCLIFMAIEDSPYKALPVKEIYGWIQEHFPFYRTAPAGWKNSVRHNLSLNKCFRRVEKTPRADGHAQVSKGSFWTVESQYRTNLMETLKRSPCVYPWKYANDWRGKPWAAAAASLGDMPGLYRRLRVARTKGSHQTYTRRSAEGDDPEAGDGGPNPALFPFLAARLMSGPTATHIPPIRDPLGVLDDSGRLLTPQLAKSYSRMREGHFHDVTTGKTKQVDADAFPCFQRVMMISRSAAEDHTYAFSVRAGRERPDDDAYGAPPGGVSEDEAFSDDSNLSHELRARRGDLTLEGGRPGDLTPEEVEGADLLLNLAGVSRAGSPRSTAASRVQSPQPTDAAGSPPPPPPPPPATPRRRPGRPRLLGR